MARQKTTKRRSSSNVKRRRTSSRRKNRLFLPYPLLIFILLCVGVLLVAWTFGAIADEIHVRAKVPAPPVTQPAVITDPVDGSHFKATPISVKGTCPSDSYVEIFRNNVMSGSVVCSSNNDFEITISLVPDLNQLVPHVFNITDDEGPVGAPISVYYDVPQPPATFQTTTQPNQTAKASSPAPLLLTTKFNYLGYDAGQNISWPIEISGGVAPYLVNIDWGDDITETLTVKVAGSFNITHQYSNANISKITYPIKLKATDSLASQANLQFFVIINSKLKPTVVTSITPTPPASTNNRSWLWVAWPFYTVLVLMTFSFWLGEREELINLGRRRFRH